MFTAKRKLEFGNQKMQNGLQAAFSKVMSLKVNRLLPMTTINTHMKFEIETSKQTWLNTSETILPSESRNRKNQYGHKAAILKVTSLKMNRRLPMTTINMHMKFQIEIPKQTWLMLRKPCRLQTDGRTDGQTDGRMVGRTRWIQYTPLQLRWAGV